MKTVQTAQTHKYKPGQYIVSLDHLMEQERIFFMGKIVNRSWFVNWQLWRNRKFHKYMRDGINAFLDTDFSEDDMELIYTYMGLACDRWLTLMFIDHDMSIEWLKEHVS